MVKEIKSTGLVTFYDADSIEWGDNIKDKIDEGLKHCRKLKGNPYKVTHIKQDAAERIKRLGVYYMCIDDLPL